MKRIISIVAIIVLLATGLFILTGCDNNVDITKRNTKIEVSSIFGKGKFTVSVPKNEDGTPKYEFTTEKPEWSTKSGSFYLVTDTAAFSFSTIGMTYNTSASFKEKNGEQPVTFNGYLTWIEDPDSSISLNGMEKIELDGRNALRYYNRIGSSDEFTYLGYFYFIDVDDIYPGSMVEMTVNYKETEQLTEATEFDEETLAIINSLKITLNQ